MVQNKYQIFLDNSSVIHLRVVFYHLPTLQMVLVPVHNSAEFVESGRHNFVKWFSGTRSQVKRSQREMRII